MTISIWLFSVLELSSWFIDAFGLLMPEFLRRVFYRKHPIQLLSDNRTNFSIGFVEIKIVIISPFRFMTKMIIVIEPLSWIIEILRFYLAFLKTANGTAFSRSFCIYLDERRNRILTVWRLIILLLSAIGFMMRRHHFAVYY